jgi:hypothetical protein
MTILWGFDENILNKLVLMGLRPIFLGPCRSGEGHRPGEWALLLARTLRPKQIRDFMSDAYTRP